MYGNVISRDCNVVSYSDTCRKYEKEQREVFAQLRNKAHKERGLLFRYNSYMTQHAHIQLIFISTHDTQL